MTKKQSRRNFFRAGAAITTACMIPSHAFGANDRIELKQNDAQAQLAIFIDGKEAMVYQYGKQWDLTHFYPVRSPSGKLLTVQKTEPYPHHRSIWFADTVRLAGCEQVSFYNAYRSPRMDPEDPHSPYRNRIRHTGFLPRHVKNDRAQLGMTLVWEMDGDVPVLHEKRDMRVVALEDGEYFVDLTFTVTAQYGEVEFLSDWSHYAWPYVRMHPQFSEQKGGQMVNSEGGVSESEVMGKTALWVDYVNTVEGVTEGLAIFSHKDNPQPHKWFNRGYGTFGPRREDERSGKPFTLKQGNSLVRRVGILVHRGDTEAAHIADHYEKYVAGRL